MVLLSHAKGPLPGLLNGRQQGIVLLILQEALQLSNFRSYRPVDAAGHCSSSIPSMWDGLHRNQCSSFSHSRQPELRGGEGGEERREEREGEGRERKKKKEKRTLCKC